MLAFFKASESTITYPTWEERSLLLAKDASVNTRSCQELASSFTNLRPLVVWLICQSSRLFRDLASSSLGGLRGFASSERAVNQGDFGRVR
jgi:hypothetical protein